MSYCLCLLCVLYFSGWSVSAFLALWQCLLFVLHVLAFALFERWSIRQRKGIMFAYCLCTQLDYPCHSDLDLCVDHPYFTIQRNLVQLCTTYLYIFEMLSYYVDLFTVSKLFVYYLQILCILFVVHRPTNNRGYVGLVIQLWAKCIRYVFYMHYLNTIWILYTGDNMLICMYYFSYRLLLVFMLYMFAICRASALRQ